MERTITLEISDEIYEPLSRTAKEMGKTPEELATEWLLLALRHALNDPLEEFIGAFETQVPDWADQHDEYLGHALSKELHDNNEKKKYG